MAMLTETGDCTPRESSSFSRSDLLARGEIVNVPQHDVLLVWVG